MHAAPRVPCCIYNYTFITAEERLMHGCNLTSCPGYIRHALQNSFSSIETAWMAEMRSKYILFNGCKVRYLL